MREREGLEVVEIFNEELSGKLGENVRLIADRIRHYISPPLLEDSSMWRKLPTQERSLGPIGSNGLRRAG
jgi:hypothetical protein